MDVRSFKLLTGEEIIAELLAETGTGCRICRPLAVMPMRGPDGATHIGFAQWSMVADFEEEFELPYSALATSPRKVIEQVSSSYTSQVTGLVLPDTVGGQILKG